MRGVVFGAWIAGILAVVVLQSVVHLAVVLHGHRLGTFVDLDRSNGLPDVVSTVALASAAAAAFAIATKEVGAQRLLASTVGVGIAVLTLADLVHDGAHPASASGLLVIGVVCVVGLLLGGVAATSSPRARWTLGVALGVLAASFFVNGLDRLNHRFERARGEPIAEYQIVAKEGLELLGWSLVALALWDEALGRASARGEVATARASRARASSRRHAA